MMSFCTPDGKLWSVSATRANWKYPSHRALRWYVYEKFNYACCKCGAIAIKTSPYWRGECALRTNTGQSLDLDHIVPVAAGGRFEPKNLQLLCWSCNSKKGVH